MADNSDKHLIHRDDLSPEALNELQRQFPGMRVICAGDIINIVDAEIKEQIRQQIAEQTAKDEQSLRDGSCLDCGARMPGYLSMEEDHDDMTIANWRPAPGWTWFNDVTTGDIAAWQCPDCDKKESE